MDISGNIRYMYDASDQLADDLRRQAERAFEREDAEKQAAFQDRTAFEARRERIKRHFVAVLGGLDLPRTPLNTRITGTLSRDGYDTEKLMFESRPGFHVTCNLYVPHGLEKPAPGILFLCGHGEHAKAHSTYQRCCIDLVRQGIVVLAMDCVGQGERMQYIDRQTGRAWVRYGTHEHSYAGLQYTLTGGSIAQVFVWDALRAVDILCTLDYVDQARLGVTGNSGGGTQSAYMMMADERLAAAAPCCYLTSREEYMKTGQAHDAEQNLFEAVAAGLNNDDFVLAFAPKPLLIGSAASDFFCIEGVEKTYARGRAAYALYGCEENIALKTGQGPHGLSDELRTAVVNFFRKVFLGLPGDFVTDPSMPYEATSDLWCLPHGQVLRDVPGEVTVTDLVAQRVREIKRPPITPENAAAVIAELLKLPSERIPLRPRFLAQRASPHGTMMPVFFFTQPNIVAAGALHRAGAGARRLTIYVSPEGTTGYDRHTFALKELLTYGDVLDFDPRGIGALRSRSVNIEGDARVYGTLFKLNCDAIMLGTSIMAMQVFDLVRAVELAVSQGYEETVLSGEGYGAVLALLAAVMTGNRACLDDLPPSFAEIASARIYEYFPLYEVFGLLRVWDVPELIKAMGDRVEVRRIPNPGVNII